MARQTRVRDHDKFMLRLPDGMRDRIKAKADVAGISMNEAIVWCLDMYFPAPVTIEEKIDELAEMIAIFKGDDTYKSVDRLVAGVHKAIVDVVNDTVETPIDFTRIVQDRFERWQHYEAEFQQEVHTPPWEVDEPFSSMRLPEGDTPPENS